MFARIWYEPGGVKITRFASQMSDAECLAACHDLQKDGRIHPLATFEDVESEAELKTLIPQDRSQREQWRKNPAGRGVRVDPTVPSRRPQ